MPLDHNGEDHKPATTLRIATIGLGAMGLPMAETLRRAGFRLTGFDLSAAALGRFQEAGGRTADDAREAAYGADIALLALVNARQAEECLFGQVGIVPVLAPGATVVLCATIAPEEARSIAERLKQQAIGFLEAPMSGGVKRAAEGSLTFIIAGEDASLDKAKPLLDVLASHVFHVGEDYGQASAIKLLNQMLCGIHLAATAEVMAVAERSGLSPQAVYDFVSVSSGRSFMFEDRAPRMMNAHQPNTSAVDLFAKDLALALCFGQEAVGDLPLTAVAHRLFAEASDAGLGRAADSSVIELYRRRGADNDQD